MTSKCYFCRCDSEYGPLSDICKTCDLARRTRFGAILRCDRCNAVFFYHTENKPPCDACIKETKKWGAIFATKLAMVVCAISAQRLECVRGRTATPKKSILRNFARNADWHIKPWDVGIVIPALLSQVKGATKWVLIRHRALGAIRLRQNRW